MELTTDEIQHIAKLARVSLDAEELEQYITKLSDILAYFQLLQEVDTENVLPTGGQMFHESVMREDEPHDSLNKKDVLANAPDIEDDYFRVRAVLE